MNNLRVPAGSGLWGMMLVALSLASVEVRAQAGVDLLGSPIPGITAIGHHAIGVNMTLLATDRPFSDRLWRNRQDLDSLDRPLFSSIQSSPQEGAASRR